MQTKSKQLAELYEQTAQQATGSLANWTGLLTTIGKLYKYPFHEQLMIHAQRPDAIACAEYGLWNNTMNRYIRRGAKGIALIDPTGNSSAIKYVFDVADTGGREQSYRPNLWELSEEHKTAVMDSLQEKFQAQGENLPQLFDNIAQAMAMEYYKDNKRDIAYLVEDSFLEELDEDNIRASFINAMSVSLSYTLMKRCGLDTEGYFTHEDFLSIFDFNTTSTVSLLGTAVSEQSQAIFREIAITISRFERSKQHEQPKLQAQRGLSDTRPNPIRATDRATGQVWENEETAPNGTPQSPIQPLVTERETTSTPTGNRPNSQPQNGTAYDGATKDTDTARQNDPSNGMGGTHEQPQIPSGGDYIDGADLQLTPQEAEPTVTADWSVEGVPVVQLTQTTGEQLSLFPTEQQQIQTITQNIATSNATQNGSSVTLAAFSMSNEDIQVELCRGSGFVDGKFRIYGIYKENLSPQETVKRIKAEYGTGGHSHTFLDGTNGFVNYEPSKGMVVDKYGEEKKFTLKWTEIEKHLRALIATDKYLTAEELSKYEEQQKVTIGINDVTTSAEPIVEQVTRTEPPTRPVTPLWQEYTNIKAENPDKIVLYQLGDFFEAYENDAKVMSEELGLTLIPRLVGGLDERVPMVGIPSHTLEQYQQRLLDHGHDIALVSYKDGDRTSQREVRHITSNKTQELAEQDDDLFDIDGQALRELLAQSGIVDGKLVDPVALGNDPFIRQVMADVEQMATEESTQTVTKITHIDIETALLKWNDNDDSRTKMVAYMLSHSRDRGTAQWLQQEFGGNLPAFTVEKDGITQELPWVKVQRMLGKIVAENRDLLTEAVKSEAPEQTAPSQMKAETEATHIAELTLESYGTNNPDVFKVQKGSYLVGVEVQTSPALWERLAQKGLVPTKDSEERIVFETNGKEWNRFFIPDTFGNKWNNIDANDVLTHDEYTTMLEVVQRVMPQEEIQAEAIPFPYKVGDVVQLENGTGFIVEGITDNEVKLRDPSLHYPIIRAEGKENFLRLIDRYPQTKPQTDKPQPENYHITDFDLGFGTKSEKYRHNLAAIHTLKLLEKEDRQASPEEQEILSKYVGWGGLPEVFEEKHTGYQQLKMTLTETEFDMARASTLNAHYTSPTVIKAIYDGIEQLGFNGGNILEPACGVGNFFGMLPDTMANSNLYGIELDSITGRIAQKLYPKANIAVKGFEETDLPDSFFDVAIGNVPFGNYKLTEKRYDKNNFLIHDHFFAKSLDKVRAGGIVAFVTSKGTMDKKSPEVRRYLAQRAELLGAIRLPNNAFKGNAGTEVTADILFLQKRESPIDLDTDWIHLGLDDNDIAINSYFVENPHMILGEMQEISGQFGKESACMPIEGADLAEQLQAAIKHIQGQITEAELPDIEVAEQVSIPATPDVKNQTYTVVDGEVYFRENSRMVKPVLNQTATERVKGLVEIRDCVSELIRYQLEDYNDEVIKQEQGKLNELYDKFTAKFGLINSRGNALAFNEDNSYYLLCSLEDVDEDGNLISKADMFTKRTIKQSVKITSVDTPSEALAVSLSEKAKVDMAFMQEITGLSEEEIASQLKGVIFLNSMFGYGSSTEEKYLPADEYLSGNVREKLVWAKRSAEQYPEDYTVNVEALELAQPKDLDASEIKVRIGSTWIDKSYMQEFMYALFDTPRRNQGSHGIEVKYTPFTGDWNVTNKNSIHYDDVAAFATYGTDRANAYRIFEDTLNLRDTRIYDTMTDPDGKEIRVLNSEATELAQQKQQLIKDAFKDWIWENPTRRQTLVKLYNERFNSNRPREYDGSHIKFVGMNPQITLREHQINAIAHILYGDNTLLAHEVGAGKTFEMIAGAMESKRLGLCQKPLFAVPNHLTEQWASEFLRLYPAANILVATKKDFETKNRKKFCARIATGDYDAVIIGHSQFERIPISLERQERLLKEQIVEIENGIREIKASGGENYTIKQFESTKKKLQERLKKLVAQERKDSVVTFEQLGVDRLYVDEAHSFKNLFTYTKMRNVAGLSTTDAQKSSDMFLKCRYMDELTGGKGIVFATGTPVSNSMVELYTMQRYLQYHTLQEKGLLHFDSWASTFGETVTQNELSPTGKGYRPRTRFARFFNLPELMAMFKEVADIKTADELDLPTPNVEFETVVAKPTEIQQELVQELSERAERIHTERLDPSIDNMLKITSDGRKLGLDQRVVNPLLPDDKSSKVNTCISNIHRIWEDGKEEKHTQLLFCDLSTPKPRPQLDRVAKAGASAINGVELHALEDALSEDITTPQAQFSVYHDIRDKLIEKGIPQKEIAFIHEANTDARKKELFAKVRTGDIRVLLGSTAKCGAGMNVQDRLLALHDLDCPWRPGDLTQRLGRIKRQGNLNETVKVFRYVTEDTFDAYLWQTVENKQKFISQIMTSKSPVRSCEDIDEAALSFAEIKALCAGNPLIKEKMDLDIEVSRLKLSKANHQSTKYRLEDNLLKHYPESIEKHKGYIKCFEQDLALLSEQSQKATESGELLGDSFRMTVKGDVLTDKDNAGAALLAACKEVKTSEAVEIGNYKGFAMYLSYSAFGNEHTLTLKGAMSHTAKLGIDPRGNLTRIDNALGSMQGRLESVQKELENLYNQQSAAKVEVQKPFLQEQELKDKMARLAYLDKELNMSATKKSHAKVSKQARPSVLDRLREQPPHHSKSKKPSTEREVR